MRYKHIQMLFFILFIMPSTYAQTIQQTIDALIEDTLPRATIGVMITDAQSGEVVYEHNANKLLNPASNIKLFTAAAALYHLRPDDHYITSLSSDKKNIYLTFSGSPSLRTTDLIDLVSHLNRLDIKTIQGNIVLDTSQFKPPYYASGVSLDDLGWYYEAPSTAVILDRNAVTYDFISGKTLDALVQIKPHTPESPITLINEVRVASKEQAKNHCSLHIEIQKNNTLRLFGCLAQNDHVRTMQLALTDPTLYAKQIIRATLKENNIVLKGAVIDGKTPTNATRLASLQSDQLTKLITHMLKESDNLYADSLTKRLGAALTGEGTYKQGTFAIKKILTAKSHLDMHQLELTDGQGTRYNVVSPKQLTVLLTDLYHDETIKPIFLNALPNMGVSGTLKDRMKNTPLEKHVLAKTGSMHDISALSGYLTTPTGKTMIFSIVSNGINGKLNKAKALEEKILLTVSSEATEAPLEKTMEPKPTHSSTEHVKPGGH